MKIFVTGAVLVSGLAFAFPANAAPGQCSVTGYDTFECDVAFDGGGLTFALPDGQTLVFSHVGNGEGIGYLAPVDLPAGRYPTDLGVFRPVEGEPGCWLGDKEGLKFCAAVAE